MQTGCLPPPIDLSDWRARALEGLLAPGADGCDVSPDRVAGCVTPDGMIALAWLVEELLAWHRLANIQCERKGTRI